MPGITVRGRPVPKSMAKTDKRIYKPAKVAKQEKLIADMWKARHRDVYWSKAKLTFSLTAVYHDEKHADLKNLIYLAEDALSETAFNDDKQIIAYDPPPGIFIDKDEKERTVIQIERVDEQQHGFKEVEGE